MEATRTEAGIRLEDYIRGILRFDDLEELQSGGYYLVNIVLPLEALFATEDLSQDELDLIKGLVNELAAKIIAIRTLRYAGNAPLSA
jgi:hypothetical protein